jgi:hypothetical protein
VGPFLLTVSTIDAVVTSTSPGIFLLGRSGKSESFRISCVGRADEDVKETLKQYVRLYPEFKFEYCSSAKDAFEKECGLYHTFKPSANKAHPVRPKGLYLRCPGCLTYG